MIQISQMAVGPEGMPMLEEGLTPLKIKILRLMAASASVYSYDSPGQLWFELRLREEIVSAARDFHAAKVGFATFKETRCNRDYWELTEEGGIRLKEGKEPSSAIEDIFRNGRKYAMECATAMVVILYRGVLAAIGKEAFNRLFQALYLYDWKYDKDLGLRTRKDSVYLPGDVQYFDNPDFDPDKPQWRGENVINLGDGLYYGHGIGIGPADFFISRLNRLRKAGAVRSAYLLDQATRPDFKYLSRFSPLSRQGALPLRPFNDRFMISHIGSHTYIS